jgi:hypothetical protein
MRGYSAFHAHLYHLDGLALCERLRLTPQEATEAANITSYQMRDSFGAHESIPGRLTVNTATPTWVRQELVRMGEDDGIGW